MIKLSSNLSQLLKDGGQQLLSGRGRRVKNLNCNFFNTENITRKPSNFIGVKEQRVFLIAAVLRIELTRVERGVKIAGVGVGVAINGGS